jgi:multimeric flavodoxin WrbA
MKKILGLISSPRKNGNSEIMMKEITLHTGSDNRLEMLRLLDLHIESCKGCYYCMKPGKKCPRDDDMEFLFHKIAEADGIILSCPVYNWGVNSGIRRIFDRAFLFRHWADIFQDKPCVTFVTFGVPYEEGYALSVLNQLVRQFNFRLKDSAAFLGASPGDVFKYEENMEMAKQLGRALFDPSYKRRQGNVECPNCFSSIIKFRSDGVLPPIKVRPVSRVECAFCGTGIEIKASQEGIDVHYHGKGLYDEEFPKRLSEWHQTTIESFKIERKDVEKLVEKYKDLDVTIVAKRHHG